MNKDKFQKRSGTTDQGKDYENILVAYYSLKLVLDNEVADFKISSNDQEYGNFDDLVIQITYKDGSNEQFNVQAKHKQTNRNKNLLLEALRAEKGKFSVIKRFEEFCEKPDENKCKYVLFTNRKFEIRTKTEVLTEENCVVCINPCETQKGIINTVKGKSNSVYEFLVQERRNLTTEQQREGIKNFENFFQNFYLYTNQKNLNEIRDVISTIFQEHFKSNSNSAKNYLEFITRWSNFDGKKDRLNKEFLQLLIAKNLLAPYILIPKEINDTEKSLLFKKAINAFDLTVIDTADIAFWTRTDLNRTDLEALNSLGIKHQILTKKVKNLFEITPFQKVILLWLLEKDPLILKVTNEPLILKAIDLCQWNGQKKKFVLVGIENLIPKWTVFQNLSDLFIANRKIYEKIVTKFRFSLRGQKEASLAEVIDEDEQIRSVFTTKELLLMLEDGVSFGSSSEPFHGHYIERKLTKITVDFNFIDRIHDSIVISSNEKLGVLKNNLKDCNFQIIDEIRDSSDSSDSPDSPTTKFFTKHNIYVANKFCPKEVFQKICEENSSCHHFQIDDSDNLEWLESSKSVDNLRNFQKTEHFVEEKHIIDVYRLNLICAPAGMGKSMMMLNLKKNYPSKFWVVKIQMREHVKFFEENPAPEEFIDYLFSKETLTEFERNIFSLFKEKIKLVLIWDGIDEVSRESFNPVLKAIEVFKGQGFIQWVTARTNLKRILEDNLNVLARNIKPFERKDQEMYIKKNLQGVPNLDQLTQVIIRNTDDDHLAIPLQISMLTELYRHNNERCNIFLKFTFSTTDLFEFFVDEKFNFYYSKANIDFSNNIAKEIVREHKNQRLEDYQIVALNLCLSSKILENLNLPKAERFLQKIQTEGDSFGILEMTNKIPSFAHRTHAEYFVALWLSKNYSTVKNLESFFFEENFKGVRFMFDLIMAKECPLHLAVLHKCVEEIKNHLDKAHLQDRAGRSPLHVAASWGSAHPPLQIQQERKKILLGADKAFLTRSESEGYIEILNLLSSCCDVKEKDKLFQIDCFQYADSSFSLAAIDTFSKISTLKLENLQNFKDLPTVIFYVIKFDYVSLLQTITEIPYVETTTGGSLLHLCAILNRKTILLKLLQNKEYKKAINKTDKRNWAPLHYVSCNGYVDLLKILTDMGADIHLGSKNGTETPLFVAAQCGQAEILKILLQNGGKVNSSKKNGWTPLMVATQKSNFNIVQLLVEHKADVNMRNQEGFTPLYVASRKGDLQLVKFLVKNNAKIDLCGKNGEGPMYIAAKLGHLNVVKFLIKKKADVNGVKFSGWSPLMIATKHGHLPVVKLLLENKASCNNISKNGLFWQKKQKQLDALDLAVEKYSIEIARLLLQHGAKIHPKHILNSLKQASRGCMDMVNLLSDHGAEIKPSMVARARFVSRSSTMKFQKQSRPIEPSIINDKKPKTLKKRIKWVIIITLIIVVFIVMLFTSSVLNFLIDLNWTQ